MAPLGLGVGLYGLGPTLRGDATVMMAVPKSVIHWYKFNHQIAVTGTGVGTWTDTMPAANHLQPTAQDDADEQPALTSGGLVFFEQATDSLVFGSALSLGQFSIYFKHNFKSGQTVANNIIMEGSSDFIELESPTEARINIGALHKITIDEIIEGTPYVFGIERDGAGDIKAYKDNVVGSEAGGTSNNVAISTTCDLTQVGDPLEESYFYEIIICDEVLTASERTALFNYLTQVG